MEFTSECSIWSATSGVYSHKWQIKLNTRGSIRYFQVIMYYSVYFTSNLNWDSIFTTLKEVKQTQNAVALTAVYINK